VTRSGWPVPCWTSLPSGTTTRTTPRPIRRGRGGRRASASAAHSDPYQETQHRADRYLAAGPTGDDPGRPRAPHRRACDHT
jgi:hypothetical protein